MYSGDIMNPGVKLVEILNLKSWWEGPLFRIWGPVMNSLNVQLYISLYLATIAILRDNSTVSQEIYGLCLHRITNLLPNTAVNVYRSGILFDWSDATFVLEATKWTDEDPSWYSTLMQTAA